MGGHAARLLGDGAGGLASGYSDHEVFRSVQATLTRAHHPAEISAVGSEFKLMRSNNAREPKRTLAGQHEREFSVEQTNERGAYSTFTSTALAFGFSAFGRCTKRTPSLNSARSLSSATFSGKLKDRTKLP